MDWLNEGRMNPVLKPLVMMLNYKKIKRGLWSPLVLVLASLAFLAACGDDDEECQNRFDCPAEQVCSRSVCTLPSSTGSCVSDDECPRGESCQSRLCRPVGDGPNNPDNNSSNPDNNSNPSNNSSNPSNNNAPDMGNNNTPDIGNNDEPDEPEDLDPPEIVQNTPSVGQTDVPVDTDIVITFNEPIRDFGLEFKVEIWNVDSNTQVETSPRLEGNILTLDPTEDLVEGAPYQVVVSNEVADLAGNRLPDEVRWFFSTAIRENNEHRALALKFAPVVHQEIDSDTNRGRVDYFTRVDFDGNYDAQDNFANHRNADIKAAAYYNVIESKTHYFIQYLFYYPGYFEGTTNNRLYPHDVSTVQVVVRKADGDASDDLFLLAESGYGQGGEFSFAVDGLGLDERNQGDLVHFFPEEEFWRDSHYLSYHGQNFHGACHWNWEPGLQHLPVAAWCNHVAGEFRNPESSVAFYPGDQSQGRVDVECDVNDDAACAPDLGISCVEGTCRDDRGLRALGYTLIDFRSTLWVRRTNVNTNINLFESSRTTYNPHSESGERPGLGEGLRFPVGLVSDNPNNKGGLPFDWDSFGSVSRGQWWLDPAYTFYENYRLEMLEEDGVINEGVSVEYCYNPYLNIDNRGQEGCE